LYGSADRLRLLELLNSLNYCTALPIVRGSAEKRTLARLRRSSELARKEPLYGFADRLRLLELLNSLNY